MFTLTRILSPISIRDFLDRHWGKKALYLDGPSDKFNGLFGWDEVERILNRGRPSFEGINLLYEKNSLPLHELKRIDHWLQKGATLLVRSVDQIDERVDDMASELGNELNTRVNVNCYVSCPAKQGFDLHFDKHDVYVIQAKGRKKWRVYEPTSVKWPMEKQQYSMDDPPKGDPYLECDLAEGDVLYIPRGHWHYALAESPSIHLSIGPEPRTGIDLLNWLTKQLMDQDDFFRRDFPVIQAKAFGGDREDAALESHVAEFCVRMRDLLDRKELFGRFVRYCMQANPVRRRYQMPVLWEIQENISPQTRFAFVCGQKALFHYDRNNSSAAVQLRGHSFIFHGPESLFVNLFSRNNSFSGRDLLEACPQIPWEKLKDVLIRLYQAGLVLQTP